MVAPAIRVLLVDDDRRFREGLRLLLESDAIEIIAEAANGREALWQLDRVDPEVVLMDLRMPVMDGIEATRRIAMRPRAPRVVALTTFDEDRLVFEALRVGAVSYLLKDAEPEAIVQAIRSARTGESVMAPAVARKVIDEFARLSRLCGPASADPSPLSKRELEILTLLTRGASNKEIATKLGIGDGTVRNHLTKVYRKLGVGDRLQAALKAHELGIA